MILRISTADVRELPSKIWDSKVGKSVREKVHSFKQVMSKKVRGFTSSLLTHTEKPRTAIKDRSVKVWKGAKALGKKIPADAKAAWNSTGVIGFRNRVSERVRIKRDGADVYLELGKKKENPNVQAFGQGIRESLGPLSERDQKLVEQEVARYEDEAWFPPELFENLTDDLFEAAVAWLSKDGVTGDASFRVGKLTNLRKDLQLDEKQTGKAAHQRYKSAQKAVFKILGQTCATKADKKAMKKAISEHCAQKLNKRAQKKDRIFEKTLVFKTKGGEPGHITLGHIGHGVVFSQDVSSLHMVSSYRSELRVGEDKPIYSFFRHGTLCAFGRKDETERKTATGFRTGELLESVADSINPADLQVFQKKEDGVHIIPFVDINVETPDLLRSAVSRDKTTGITERRHIEEQSKALELVGKRKFKVGDKSVRFQPLQLCFPINDLSELLPANIGFIKEMNQRNLNVLFEEDFLKTEKRAPECVIQSQIDRLGDNLSEKNKNDVQGLIKKIHELTSKSYPSPEDNLYLSACLITLCNLVKIPVGGGCKSGKDRTSYLNSVAQFVALKVNQEGVGTLPASLVQLNPDDQKLLQRIDLNNGNREVQINATGAPGQKKARDHFITKESDVYGNDPTFLSLHYGVHA